MCGLVRVVFVACSVINVVLRTLFAAAPIVRAAQPVATTFAAEYLALRVLVMGLVVGDFAVAPAVITGVGAIGPGHRCLRLVC